MLSIAGSSNGRTAAFEAVYEGPIPSPAAMKNHSYSDIVSTLALLAALSALTWNIVRDYLADKMAVKLSVAFGEIGSIRNSNTALFADAGSLLPQHKFDNPGMFVSIVNAGRKPIGVHSVGGEFKNGEHFSIAVAGLHKVLNPYEVFSTTSSVKPDFVQSISKGQIKNIWATDTTDKKWFLSRKGWKRLRKTAQFIQDGKHN